MNTRKYVRDNYDLICLCGERNLNNITIKEALRYLKGFCLLDNETFPILVYECCSHYERFNTWAKVPIWVIFEFDYDF